MYNAHGRMAPQAPNPRLIDLLDQIRQEFDQEARKSTEYEVQITGQINEVELVRSRLLQLERDHQQMKAKYEDDLARLQRELDNRGGPSQSSHHHGPSQPPPPSIGHGPSNLFGGIMAGSAAQGGPGLAPPPQEQPQPQGLPPHMPQGPPGLNPAPGPPSHAPFGGYQPAPAVNGYGQVPPPTASPGGKPRPRGPPGPATPQQNSAAPYPGSPQQAAQSLLQSNTLADLEVDQLPQEFKKEGQDWFAVFNPKIQRRLDVDLLHNLVHASVVCCVRFSHDGRYVATGCNRSAQIYEVETGQAVAHLQDGNLPDDGDLYIRSVCFSPDGLYLATGAEDKIIRVWEIATRTIRHQFIGHEQDIYSLDFSRNGEFIASGSGDRTVRLWNIRSNQQSLQLSIEDGVTTVAISPDNRFVAAGSLDKSVRVWDANTGRLVERLEGEQGHKDSVYSVAFAPTGDRLVSGSLDKTIKMWELTTQPHMMPGSGPRGGKCLRTFEGHKDFVLSVALTPHGEWVLSGSKDRGVQFWDPNTGVAQLMLQGHKNSVISVAPSPTGGVFATGSGDMRARIWRYGAYNGPS
ncbi:WD40 repeat-like protein [Mytilinidion resinicola]|uniref:WD40 repeat-like protein n=1 Tax=Mytilinidion resinicola TaxID=574789 RepID=A0A6A6YSG6_9PEZI|nr:WD40 repeat-like protein [Mytilinidion resinicola]KAF2811449.1 WD40 repeat-like protein [Mytilinidion resinicola]